MADREPTVLYEGGGIKISDWPQVSRGHFLHIGGNPDRGYALLEGVLEDLSRRESLSSLEGSLNQINPEILYCAGKERISVDQIRFAFTQARIRELDDMASSLFSKLREAEENLAGQ